MKQTPRGGRYRIFPPILSVQRAFVSFCAALLGSSGQISVAVFPALTASFSGSVLRCLGPGSGSHLQFDPTCTARQWFVKQTTRGECTPSCAVANRTPSSQVISRMRIHRPASACRSQSAGLSQPVSVSRSQSAGCGSAGWCFRQGLARPNRTRESASRTTYPGS